MQMMVRNTIIQPMHIYLSSLDSQRNEEDVLLSFRITSSPRNQRIESYWSCMRRDRIGWWKSFFEDMVDLELFESDIVVVECIRFCFMELLHNELNSILNDSHIISIISKSRNSGPSGRQDSMVFFATF